MNNFFGNGSPWCLGGVLLVCLIIAIEGGFRWGRWRTRQDITHDIKSQVSSVMGSLFTLVALLLGFSFAMVMSRVETRRQLVVEEANAVGTAYLRAQLIAEPAKTEVSALLTRYVDIRVGAVRQGQLVDAMAQSEQIIGRLWSIAITVAAKAPHDSVVTGLFLTSLNEMIDTHAKRLNAELERIPALILALLMMASIIVGGVLGYSGGLIGNRNFALNILLTVLIVAVVFVIVDLDRPQEGLIKVNQRALELLHNSFAQPTP